MTEDTQDNIAADTLATLMRDPRTFVEFLETETSGRKGCTFETAWHCPSYCYYL